MSSGQLDTGPDKKALCGSIRAALETLRADIGEVKVETRTTLMEASMVRALLVESEKAVKRDINTIRIKLEEMLRLLERSAIDTLRATVTKTKEEVGTEMATLEAEYHSLEEFETEIESTVSNLSVKPLETGMKKISGLQAKLQATRESMYKKNLAFILNPLLADIMDDVEEFSLGDIVLVARSDPILNKTEEPDVDCRRTNSDISGRTSFSRSQSHASVRSQLDDRVHASTPHLVADHTIQRTSTPMSHPAIVPTTLPKKDNRTVMELQTTSNKRSDTQHSVIQDPGETRKSVKRLSPETDTTADGSRMTYAKTIQTRQHANSCYITGIAVLPGGGVVVCDNAHDEIQLFNRKYQVISHMEFFSPWGVSTVSEKAVAVSLHHAHKLIFIKVDDDKLVHIHDKDINISCKDSLLYDIAFRQYRLFVLCSRSEIHVVDMKGKEFLVIQTVIPQNTLKFLDVDSEKKRLYASGNKGVACINFEGKLLWKYPSKPDSMFAPMGIKLHNNCVYVNDGKNYKVVELSLTGKYSRDVVYEQLEHPCAMGMSSNGETILVSQGDIDMVTSKSRLIKLFTRKI